MSAVLTDIESCLKDDPATKFVIFSQFMDSLTALKNALESVQEFKLRCALITGQRSHIRSKKKSGAMALADDDLARFHEDPECNVCLLTTGASAAGLTLTVARVCYMLEPLHNAAEEAQALNRVHRIGQTSDVRCIVFYAAETSEERILATRQQNRSLTEILSTADSAALAGLDTSGDNECDTGGTGTKRKGGGKKPNRRNDNRNRNDRDSTGHGQAANGGRVGAGTEQSGSFFSGAQLTTLFGVTDEHARELENSH
jgi:hypothetical protein